MTTRYPAAEEFARTMKLPLTVNKAVKDLYGYAKPELDETEAGRTLASAGFRVGTPAHEAAMELLRARTDAL